MDQKDVKEISEKFINNNNKQGLYFVSAAVAGGIEDGLVKKYLLPEFSPDRLLQMLIALADGVSEKSLDVLLKLAKDASAEDMRSSRLSLKGEPSYEELAEKVVACSGDIAELTKLVKKMNTKLDAISQAGLKTEEKRVKKGESKKEMLETEKEEMIKKDTIEAGMNEDTIPRCDYMVYQGDQAILLESNSDSKKNSRLKGLFRHGNKQKIVSSDELKMQTLKEILATEPPEDKLGAIIEAGKKGIPLSFLKLYTDRNASATKLSLYTKAYLAFFGEPEPVSE